MSDASADFTVQESSFCGIFPASQAMSLGIKIGVKCRHVNDLSIMFARV
jgi:hypothetical protein